MSELESRLELPQKTMQDWQKIVNIIADVLEVPAGFIMRLVGDELEIFVSNETTKHSFKAGKSIGLLEGSGVYCEDVIRNRRKLLVPNALKSTQWKNCPEIKLGFISYLGFPIMIDDEHVFGTLCVVDNKENNYCAQYEELMQRFRDVIENDIQLFDITKQLISEIDARKQAEKELLQLASTDPLTGIANRRAFFESANKEVKRSLRYERELSFLMIDIDDFKQINDFYGHSVGDELLKSFATALESYVRKNDLVARLGGEEFGILLPETEEENAFKLAKRIVEEIRSLSIDTGQQALNFSISIGVSVHEKEEEDIMLTYERADAALYEAKEKGKDRASLA